MASVTIPAGNLSMAVTTSDSDMYGVTHLSRGMLHGLSNDQPTSIPVDAQGRKMCCPPSADGRKMWLMYDRTSNPNATDMVTGQSLYYPGYPYWYCSDGAGGDGIVRTPTFCGESKIPHERTPTTQTPSSGIPTSGYTPDMVGATTGGGSPIMRERRLCPPKPCPPKPCPCPPCEPAPCTPPAACDTSLPCYDTPESTGMVTQGQQQMSMKGLRRHRINGLYDIG